MTTWDAISAVQEVGSVEVVDGKLKLIIPATARNRLQPAIETLSQSKEAALALLLEPNVTEITAASTLLNRIGARLMQLDGTYTIGLWPDLDGPNIRAALRTLGMESLPIRYLTEQGIPARYQSRDTTA